MQLSKYFTLEDLTKSATARAEGIDNSPDVFAQNNLQQLALRLDFLYDQIGPFRISSGYRSPALNDAIHGAANSYHTRGIAADIIPENDTPEGYFKKIATSSLLNQLGEVINEADEKGVVHVSLPTPEKTGVLLYLKDGGYYRYSKKQLDELLGADTSSDSSDTTEEESPQLDTSITDVETDVPELRGSTQIIFIAALALMAFVGLSLWAKRVGAKK